MLSNQQARMGIGTVRRDLARPGMESLTYCQANRTRVGGRKVRRDPAGPGMKSLTRCQANRTRVGRRKVRRDLTGPGMKLLTFYHANPAMIVRAYSLPPWTWKLNHLFSTILSCQPQGKCFPDLRWHPAHYTFFNEFLVKTFFHHKVSHCTAQHQSVSTM